MGAALNAFPLSATEAVRGVGSYKALILEALEHGEGRESWDVLFDRIGSGDTAVWICTDGTDLIGVATICVRRGDVGWLQIENIAGRRADEWLHFAMEKVERWYERYDIKQMVFIGRPGWERYLKGWGFEVKAIVSRRMLA